MHALKTMWGVLRYEFLMQIRRPALWLAFLGFILLVARSLISGLHNPELVAKHLPSLQLAATITLLTNWLAPLGVGILLADRLRRDRRTKVEELLNTLPGTLRMRLLGKYLGTTLASLIPAFLLFGVMIALAVWITGNVGLIPASLLCYVAIVLPGMLLIAAFSIACPVAIWVPLYQFLFFGYWFWGNLIPPSLGLPTLSGTILTPIGSFIGAGLFGIPSYGEIGPSPAIDGVASIVALVGIATLVLVVLYQFLRFEQARQ
jgi:ABC-2 type transport system permease protein